MRYMVTGATGFIGGRLVRHLLAVGHEVRALVRDPARAAGLEAMGVELHRGDILERDSLRAPMEGIDGLFHLAAWYKVGARDRSTAERTNVDGTRNVLEVMRELGVEKGVYTSTVAVFSDTHGALADESYRHGGTHLSEYDRTKWLAHYEVAEPMMRAGLPLVIVQPGAVYGPNDPSAVAQMLRGYLRRRLPACPARTAMCWGHVDDTARGHILAMEKGRIGESYILAGEPYTLIEVLALAERLTGIRAPRLHLPPALMKLMARLMGLIGGIVPLPETLAAESLRVSAGTTYLGSSEKARRELGFSVRPLEEGLSETLSAEMERMGISPRRHDV
jgi:nucleoside-diphosphate-sugar epimerase